jgi:hypothetical protein
MAAKKEKPMVITSYGPSNPGTDMVPEDFTQKPKRLLKNHVDSHYAAADEKPAYEVYIVWFTYILGGWKANLATDMPDGKYYELTYNAAKQETYIDEYVKVVNVVVQD